MRVIRRGYKVDIKGYKVDTKGLLRGVAHEGPPVVVVVVERQVDTKGYKVDSMGYKVDTQGLLSGHLLRGVAHEGPPAVVVVVERQVVLNVTVEDGNRAGKGERDRQPPPMGAGVVGDGRVHQPQLQPPHAGAGDVPLEDVGKIGLYPQGSIGGVTLEAVVMMLGLRERDTQGSALRGCVPLEAVPFHVKGSNITEADLHPLLLA
eukprot:9500434-Pyramimonas_sp.AAC.1